MEPDRQFWIKLVFITTACMMLLRLSQFSIFQHNLLSRLAHDQVYRSINIESIRGSIYASDGQTLLADSKPMVSVAVDTFKVRDTKKDMPIALSLSEILKVPVEEILCRFHSCYSAEWIKRDISRKEFRELVKLQNKGLLPGIMLKREIQRVYPQFPSASSILGFTSGKIEKRQEHLGPYASIYGVEGLEAVYNEELSGTPGVFEYLISPHGAPQANSFRSICPAVSGCDLITSINLPLQNILQQEIKRVFIKHQSNSAMGVIMDPKDGAILACASIENTEELKDPWYQFLTPINCWTGEARRNLSTSAVFEPGSIWKPVIMSIALENNLVQPGMYLPWKNAIVCGSKAFQDWKTFNSTIRLDEILTYSSNVGIIQVSKKVFNALSSDEIATEIRRLGFSRRLPVDYPVQPSGILNSDGWGPISVGALAEGYEVSVSQIQLGAFYCAIANGGYKINPHFGRSLVNHTTHGEIKNLIPTESDRIISAETSEFVRQAMIECVDHGTGSKANIEKKYGIRAAGKTATAKMFVNGTYASGHYRPSFAGFFPAEDPRYVFILTVESPREGGYYGGQVAAPLFYSVASRILQEVWGLEPLDKEKI